MDNAALKQTILEYENYIKQKGVDASVVNAYYQASQTTIKNLGDIELGLKISGRAKQVIEAYCRKQTGGTIKALDMYSYKHHQTYDLLDKYYEILKLEAQNKVLDSYLLYLERRRNPIERFYWPKREQFLKIGVIQALQDMLDDKLDLLTISLPPGTGKASSLNAKVLTPSGFVRMRNIHVGDKVIAGNGNIATVLGVFPQGTRPTYRFTLDDGSQTEVSDEHLWLLKRGKARRIRNTEQILKSFSEYQIPVAVFEDGCAYPRLVEDKSWHNIQSIDYIGEEECQCIYISDPCHLYITDDYIITHNTTLEKFFHSGVMGWFPNHFNLFYSHSSDITKMYYDGVLNILTDPDEYTWGEIFPECSVSNTNAKLEQININKYKPFPNLQTTSVGSKNAGKVRCNKFLLVDDMIGGIEEALNKTILDKLWDKYAVDARQRKIQDENGVICKEIHIATRWSVHDIIGRLERAYEGNPRARFIAVPDIDETTGKSNFAYEYNGFSEEFFKDQALLMDDISYRCLYKNEPIEREGLLYHDDDLRRYLNMPDKEPDAILGVCDTKQKGTDFMVLPIMYQYGQDYYLADCVCDDSADYGYQYDKLTTMINEHNMQQLEFESNSGGDRVAHEVSTRLEKLGARVNITTKPTETNKETRIIVNSDWIKKHVLFKDKDLYAYNSDYGRFMRFVLSYSVAGKNEHDDVCDALANFALFATKDKRVNRIEVPVNPFRTGGYGSFYDDYG